MIVLWILSLLIVFMFVLVAVFRGVEEGQGAIKWLVVSMLLLVLVTLIWMGVKIWLRN